MMRVCLSADMMERARRAIRSGKRILRELPFVHSLGPSAIEEGKIDLLFEEEGGWVLIDYKTDWVSKNKSEADEYFRKKYSGQVQGYLEALQKLSLKSVSAYLLLARTGDAVRIV